MNNGKKEIEKFKESISDLFADIEKWLSEQHLGHFRENIDLKDRALGTYTSEKLIIVDADGSVIAEFVPVGADVIGADGRIDLIGGLDRTSIVKTGSITPSMTSTIEAGKVQGSTVTSFFRGIEGPGWYWIEDKRRGKAHKFEKELFWDLLAEVSDYEAA